MLVCLNFGLGSQDCDTCMLCLCLWWIVIYICIIYMCVIYSCVIYIYDVYLVCNDGRLKTKKIEFFHFFAECHGIWNTKLPSFAECHGQGTRQRKLKKQTALPSAYLQHSAKKIQKKIRKQALPTARFRHSAKHFFKKNKKHISLPSADAWHSAKGPSL